MTRTNAALRDTMRYTKTRRARFLSFHPTVLGNDATPHRPLGQRQVPRWGVASKTKIGLEWRNW